MTEISTGNSALFASHLVTRQVGRKMRTIHAGSANPATSKRVSYIRALRLDPDPYGDDHQKHGKPLLEHGSRNTLRESRSKPGTDEQSECDPQRCGHVEIAAPVILPGAEQADGKQQRSE